MIQDTGWSNRKQLTQIKVKD